MILGSWLFLMAILVAIAIATGGEGKAPESRRATPVETIAKRVEGLRGVRFTTVPEPLTVTPAQTRREGMESFDEHYAPARRRADEEVLERLGVVGPGLDLRAVTEDILEGQVAGYYDPERKRLRVVDAPGTGGPVFTEIVLAHELVHALEDQRFGLRLDALAGIDDRVLAYGALVEGTASAVMYEYADRHFSGEELLFGLLASAFAPPPGIPAFLQEQLVFPYDRGQAFVERLHEVAGERWLLVDLAFRERPPVSTEQVLHPEAYLRDERPARVRIAAPAGWREVTGGTLGEFQTRQVLHQAGGTGARAAAEGWGGDRYALLGRGGERALVVRWRLDTPRDGTEFLDALRAYSRAGVADGFTTVAEGGGAVTLVIADSRATAGRLAASGR